MDAAQTFAQINWLAVIVATIVSFALGGLWYGPLFGRVWMAETGIRKDSPGNISTPVLFSIVFLLTLVIAISLAMFIGPNADVSFGVFAGFMAGFTFVAMSLGVIYLFERRSFRHWAVNAGFQIALFTVMGAILGAWR
jgi:Protein of unknown function (DUF1761)